MDGLRKCKQLQESAIKLNFRHFYEDWSNKHGRLEVVEWIGGEHSFMEQETELRQVSDGI